jgi:hypothetical protein
MASAFLQIIVSFHGTDLNSISSFILVLLMEGISCIWFFPSILLSGCCFLKDIKQFNSKIE